MFIGNLSKKIVLTVSLCRYCKQTNNCKCIHELVLKSSRVNQNSGPTPEFEDEILKGTKASQYWKKRQATQMCKIMRKAEETGSDTVSRMMSREQTLKWDYGSSAQLGDLKGWHRSEVWTKLWFDLVGWVTARDKNRPRYTYRHSTTEGAIGKCTWWGKYLASAGYMKPRVVTATYSFRLSKDCLP